MFWYDIHFVFSNKIFKRYDIDEISPYSNIPLNWHCNNQTEYDNATTTNMLA